MSEPNTKYPRQLTDKEWMLLEWLLPEDKPGYKVYRSLLTQLQVIGTGRWGEGDLILGHPSDTPDTSGPMERVFAHGYIETDNGKISISIHEFDGSQLEIQIVNAQQGTLPDELSTLKRATYSTWNPGNRCQFCGAEVREVIINRTEPRAILVICREHKSIWLYDESDKVNFPIPSTNYYNELMLLKNIRDPKIALNSANLFRMLDEFADGELREAFVRYNKTWRRITIRPEAEPRKHATGTFKLKLLSFLRGKKL